MKQQDITAVADAQDMLLGPLPVNEISALTLNTKTGEMDITLSLVEGLGLPKLLVRFSPDVTAALYTTLARSQAFLEEEAAGEAPSSARH